jgi:hypothetical protein
VKLKAYRLRLCRSTRIDGGLCRAYAVNNGYCWHHHLSIFGFVMWGDHTWEGL